MPHSVTDDQLADLAEIVSALSRTIERRHADADITELTVSEHAVMRFVDRNPGTTPSAIAHAVDMQRPNVSALLRRLEEKGLLMRTDAPGDGRGVTVTSTPRAAENLRRLRQVWSGALSPARGAGDIPDLTERLTEIHDLLSASRG
ncbi:MarR family winged helix-turn-helix transcriptional regulator [Microbacterium indicum]|uniref:MarR family winged helix-turn-helix transcriptional regulator n=1 Tax=Microbacterium indicum TaxID=358100 RepID=UPI000410DE14|nr:MarR family transcriptional regulator [Microbacterium indicum]